VPVGQCSDKSLGLGLGLGLEKKVLVTSLLTSWINDISYSKTACLKKL